MEVDKELYLKIFTRAIAILLEEGIGIPVKVDGKQWLVFRRGTSLSISELTEPKDVPEGMKLQLMEDTKAEENV